MKLNQYQKVKGGIIYGKPLNAKFIKEEVAPLSNLKRILSEDIEKGSCKAYNKIIK